MDYQLVIDDLIGRDGYSKNYVRDVLSTMKGQHVDMNITSLGGDLDHGLDIYEQLRNHGDVTAYLTGFVASAATVIAMGASTVKMSKYAMMLVHKCSNFIDAWGLYNADQMQALIEQLTENKQENDKIDVLIARLYSEKCGKTIPEILDILKEARWLTAEEALDYGFIDEIVDIPGESKLNFTTDLAHKFNAFSLPTNGLELSEPSSMRLMLTRILDAVRSLAAPAASTKKIEKMIETTDFAAVNGVLNVASLSANEEGSILMSAADMKALNDALSSKDNQINDLSTLVEEQNTLLEEKETIIENLKNLPGDETECIADDTHEVMTSEEVYNLIKNL